MPRRGILRAVQHRQNLNAILKDHIVDNMLELSQPYRPHILPHQGEQLRHRFDALQHLPNTRYKPITQTGLHLLEFAKNRLDVGIG